MTFDARAWRLRFGARLFELRTARDLTQFELAELAGLDRRAIIRYERLEQIPRLDAAVQLASALGVTLDELACGR